MGFAAHFVRPNASYSQRERKLKAVGKAIKVI